MKTIDQLTADQIVASNHELSFAIMGAADDAGTPEQDMPQARRCAAYLYCSGWTDRQLAIVYGGKEKKHSIKARRRDAVKDLQRFGYLPTGWEWFLLRWVVLPFLSSFISRIIFDRLWSDDAHKTN